MLGHYGKATLTVFSSLYRAAGAHILQFTQVPFSTIITVMQASYPGKMEQKMLQIIQKVKSLRELKQIHLQIIVHSLGENNFILAKLMDLSSAFHSLNYAMRIFQNARSRNVVVHNTMIKCFVEKGCQNEAFSACNKMRALGIPPNNFTFSFLLKACESLESLKWSKGVHCQILRFGFGCYIFVQNALLGTYARCTKDIDLARQLFDDMSERDVVSWNSIIGAYMERRDMARAMAIFELMPERNVVSWNSVITGLSRIGDMASARSVFDQMPTRNTISWNTLISGYVMSGDVSAAKSIFDQMEDKDVVSWTTMISAYTKIGDLECARKVFDEMPVKNVVSWNAMIAGYNENCRFNEALSMFQLMLLERRFPPDEATLTSVISACAHLGSLEHGNWIHSYIKKNNIHLTIALGNALIDMFAKCGDIKYSESVFKQMPRKCIITWTTMISGLAYNGQCRDALALFKRMSMEGMEVDDVIFIAVLSACTHGGFVEEGQIIYKQMVEKHGIRPRMEHYGCMVDLLGRAGKLEKALKFIQNMPMEPNAVLWATLLSSCVSHGAQELVEFVSQKIVDLEPLSSCYQVLVSNSGAVEGKWDSVVNVRAMMRKEGIKKVPGCSSIQVGGEVHEFLVKDTRHKRRKEIYDALDGLTELMRQLGYTPFRGQLGLLYANADL
ncbi:pentatricopeptide repeat-containing protein At3g29230-like [Musa acuminata AAA Group]|uniref:pentatricopeptide repeat-containing protein At3g29230-like n=1 Tax=Musa acuminata AAA Group TaxID=214697 RepID=UPI0031DA3005